MANWEFILTRLFEQHPEREHLHGVYVATKDGGEFQAAVRYLQELSSTTKNDVGSIPVICTADQWQKMTTPPQKLDARYVGLVSEGQVNVTAVLSYLGLATEKKDCDMMTFTLKLLVVCCRQGHRVFDTDKLACVMGYLNLAIPDREGLRPHTTSLCFLALATVYNSQGNMQISRYLTSCYRLMRMPGSTSVDELILFSALTYVLLVLKKAEPKQSYPPVREQLR